MNRLPPDTPAAFADEPPECHVDDRLFYRLQWLIYGVVGVVVIGIGVVIYSTMR